MQALQRSIQMIAAQMRALTPTAKLLIGSLMIILVMSLFLVSLYAGRRDMVALGLQADVSNEVKTQVVNYLKDHGIAYEARGTDVFVASDQKIAVLGQLADKQLIEGDQIDFETIVAEASPFSTNAQDRTRLLIAKMNVVSGMIAQMDGIERAKVIIDAPDHGGGIGRASIPPSASVTVRTRGGELGQTQVDAIANLVARSHAGLKIDQIAVIDARTGRALSATDSGGLASGRYLEVKRAAESHVKSALNGALDFIPGVRIQVNAQVNVADEVKRTSSFEDPKIGVTNESSRSLNSMTALPSAEPAVRPNTGVNLAMGRNGSQITDETSDTSSIPAFGRSESQIRDPKGYPLQINATIGVPRSYFTQLMKESTAAPAAVGEADSSTDANAAGPATTEPDPAALDAFVVRESERLREYIKPLIDTQAIDGAVAGTVTVTMVRDVVFDDSQVTQASAAGFAGLGSADGLGGAAGVSGDLVKTVGLGSLALVSMAMMFLMVRRASSKPALPTAQELVGIPPALAGGDNDLVGEADESSPALEGVELTDDAMRRQQMLEQITSMINNTPEEAASLLRRWIKSEA